MFSQLLSRRKKAEMRGNMNNEQHLDRKAEEKYLENIIEKLKVKISALDESIESNDEEIQKMDEYYWENYNEFDEYGYENFDNRQNRLSKVSENADKVRERYRYEKMLDSPYFARVDFKYDGDDEAETYYIGIGNFAMEASQVPLVFDWRAPVSGLFYDFDKGPAGFMAPAGEMTGEICAKRQYKIAKGELKYFFESDINIDDDVLKRELSLNGSDRLKSIVTTIQKEQNAIIRDKSAKILVVQGTAGSGKTSIALHRVAYLLYNSRGQLKANNVLILSPNNVFADYISHILPELNEENISEMEFDYFAAKELVGIGKCQDRYDQIEEIIAGGYGENTKYKQSREFAREINGYVLELEADIVNFRPVKYKKIEKTEQELEVLFYEKFPDIPLLKRMDAIAEYAIDEAETLTGKDFDEMEVEIIKEKFNRLYETTDILNLYGNMLINMGMEYDFESDVIKYEDVFPVLYLKYMLCGTRAHRPVKHLIIDEMQDYSYIQYAIIRKVFKCHMTILGDRHQTIGENQIDAVSYIRELFGRDTKCVELKKSYRQTVEIGKFAADIIGENDIEFFERHGREPQLNNCGNEDEMFNKMLKTLGTQLTESGYETAAVLCYSENEAKYVHEKLKKLSENSDYTDTAILKDMVYMDKETEKFKKGITVTTFYMAKGLEFDCVHIPYCDEKYENSGFGKQAKYISATRAMHELDMYVVE